jgi:hypothetical protein
MWRKLLSSENSRFDFLDFQSFKAYARFEKEHWIRENAENRQLTDIEKSVNYFIDK